MVLKNLRKIIIILYTTIIRQALQHPNNIELLLVNIEINQRLLNFVSFAKYIQQ